MNASDGFHGLETAEEFKSQSPFRRGDECKVGVILTA